MTAEELIRQFGADLRKLRRTAGLDQRGLAKRLARTGGQSWVSDIERGILPARLSVDDVLAWVRVCAPQKSTDLAKALELAWRDRHSQVMLLRAVHADRPPTDESWSQDAPAPDAKVRARVQLAIVNGGENYMVADGNIIIHGDTR